MGIKKQFFQQWDRETLALFEVEGYLGDKGSCDYLIRSCKNNTPQHLEEEPLRLVFHPPTAAIT